LLKRKSGPKLLPKLLLTSSRSRRAAGVTGVGAGAALGYYGVPKALAKALKSEKIRGRLKKVETLEKLLKGRKLRGLSAVALALLLGAGGRALAARSEKSR